MNLVNRKSKKKFLNNKTIENMSKFQTILAATGQDVLDKRAANIVKVTKAAMNKKLTALNDRKDNIELEILDLTDLSVETKDSLRPGDKNFNPTAWVDKLTSLHMELVLLEQEIEIVEALNTEYFEAETPEA